MDVLWWWWIAAIALIACELATGTFYLLVVACGLFAGGIAASFGFGLMPQLLVAAVTSAMGCVWVQRNRSKKAAQIESQRNEDVQIDVGNAVTVDVWQVNGTAQVQYRGAQWSAVLDTGQSAAAAGVHHIVAMQGNTLVLKPI